MPKWIWIFLLAINLLGFFLMGFDKNRAKKAKKMRLDEGILLGTAVLFGSVGVFLGSKIFNHKTRVKVFSLTLPLLILLHFSWLWLLYRNFFMLNGT